MPSQYKIVRVNGVSRDLEPLVQKHCDCGWYPTGQPFYDPDTREWCQAMSHAGNADKPGQVKLREPKR